MSSTASRCPSSASRASSRSNSTPPALPNPLPPSGNVPPVAVRLLGSRVDRLTLDDIHATIDSAVQTKKPAHLVTSNTLMLLEADQDAALRALLERAALSIP